MTWTRLPDNFDDQTDALSDGAFRLLVAGLVYCNRNLTDGFVPDARAPRLVARYRPAMLRELVGSGWVIPEPGGFRFDWSDQEPAEKVRKRRADRAAAQERYRQRLRDASGDASRDDSRDTLPSRPVPSRYTQGGDERSAEGMNGRSEPVATDPGFRARMADLGVRR